MKKLIGFIVSEKSEKFQDEVTSFLKERYVVCKPHFYNGIVKEDSSVPDLVEIKGNSLQKRYKTAHAQCFGIIGSSMLVPGPSLDRRGVYTECDTGSGEVLMFFAESDTGEFTYFEEDDVSANIKKAMMLLRDNFMEQINLASLAKEVGMSKYYFCRNFKKVAKKTFTEYLNEMRLNKASELLKLGSGSIGDICYDVGYNDLTYFERVFKKVMGDSPSAYRKKNR